MSAISTWSYEEAADVFCLFWIWQSSFHSSDPGLVERAQKWEKSERTLHPSTSKMPSREGLSGYLSQGSSNTPRRHLIPKWLMMKDFRKKKSHAPDLVEDSSAPFRWTPSWWLSCAFSHLFNGHLWKQFIVRIDAIISHNLLGIG